GLVIDKNVRTAAHPNGYSSEREIRFVDPRVAAVSAGFERLRPLAMSELPELLSSVIKTVLASGDPAAIDWESVACACEDVGAAPLPPRASRSRPTGACSGIPSLRGRCATRALRVWQSSCSEATRWRGTRTPGCRARARRRCAASASLAAWRRASTWLRCWC